MVKEEIIEWVIQYLPENDKNPNHGYFSAVEVADLIMRFNQEREDMTKEEMLNEVNYSNYENVQRLIKEAMQKGKKSETFCMIDMEPSKGWEITEKTIERLKEDGFEVSVYNNKYGYWDGTMEVSW